MAHGLFKFLFFESDDTISSLILSEKRGIITPTYRNAMGPSEGSKFCGIVSGIVKKRFLQGRGCHLQTEPEVSERLEKLVKR